MPVQIVRRERPPYQHYKGDEAKLFGMIVTNRKTGKVEREVGLFKDKRDFEEAMAVWNRPPLMQWSFRADPEVQPEDVVVQPVL